MNTLNIRHQLQQLGLSKDESLIFLELLKAPATHLSLSHITGINRTKVYRIVQDLEQRSLVTKRVDDRGSFLVACDPSALEIKLLEQEQQVMEQRAVLQQLVPTLQSLQSSFEQAFVVQNYDGVEGLKQMCWHELKTEGELLLFGTAALEDIIPNRYWSEKHRALNVEAGYRIREIANEDYMHETTFTDNTEFMKKYACRILPKSIVNFENQTAIYNDTVAVYHWRNDQKSGVEIINKAYADSMRQMFRHFWNIASKV